jgi:hypothetical protein
MPSPVKGYTFLTKAHIIKLEDIQSQISGSTGLHIKLTGDCGCLLVYHPLLKGQKPIVLDRNGNEVP